MKNEYFGDTRDLFKYDLVLEFLSATKLINNFTFIPMLTKDENNSYGSKTNYSLAKAGVCRVELKRFLERCLREGRRNISELNNFFKEHLSTKNLSLTIYKQNEYFSHKTREEYFEKIGRKLLTKSVILVDPDIGLEVKSMKGREEKYVTYKEVKLLYDRMDKISVLAIFQFIPRVKRNKYFAKICKNLKEKVTEVQPVYYISDNQIVFFILTKGIRSQKIVAKILKKYANRYNLIFGKV
jgi:hypothetical protein